MGRTVREIVHENAATPLTIGALAKHAGVGVETVRFYERQGLLRQPPRRGVGYRTYPEEAIAQIRFIRQAQALGFTLEEAGALLKLRITPGTKCTAVRSRAVVKLSDVEAKIEQLQKIREALEKLVAACPGKGPLAACTIMEALSSTVPLAPRTLPARRGKKGNIPVKSLEVKIEGMHCEGCASTIQALLSHHAGIKSANVSFAQRRATVFYDPEETDAAKVAAAIEKADFRVTGSRGGVCA